MASETIIVLGAIVVATVNAQGCANSAITDTVRQAFLNNHNNHRSSLARGLEKDGAGGFAPKAKQMPALVYDCSAEASAQSWASQCNWGHSPGSQRPGLGQNLHMSSNNQMENTAAAVGAGNGWWAELVENGVGQTNILTDAIWAKDVGHYTQMAWDRTTRLGCGIAHCSDMTYVVCHYGPAGNYMNQLIYTKGEPCTGCAAGTSCSTSVGLCQSSSGQTTAAVPTPTITTKSTTATTTAKPTNGGSTGCANSGMTDTIRQAFLNNHNTRRGFIARTVINIPAQFRSSLARGLEVDGAGGFAPKAKQMPALVYDCAAENLAQNWAKQCNFALLEDAEEYGQNLYATTDNDLDAVQAAADATAMWWSELAKNGVGQTNVLTNEVWNRDVGSYTQMAWDRSIRLGCGVAHCNDMTFVLCLYGPSGNYMNQVIYTKGEPCTGCAAGKTCSTSEGLCK